MNLKDMKRTDWKRITRRTYLSREIIIDGVPGLKSLIRIEEITAPLTVSSTGKPVKIVEKDYCWLQVALKDSLYWLTVMFDEEGRLLQMYFDLTAGNRFDDPQNPCFRDMYLDVVVHDNGEYFMLDQDELDDALAAGEITPAEYEQTQAACAALCRALDTDTESIFAYCNQSYTELKALLPASGGNCETI